MTSLLFTVQEAEEGAVVDAENKQYETLLASKVGNDRYLATGAQTLDNLMLLRKHKEVQTLNAESFTIGSQWDVRSIVEATGGEAAASMIALQATFAPHDAAIAVRHSLSK